MNWFEQLFGLAPDNGNGTLELQLMMLLATVAFFVISRACGGRMAARLLARLHRVEVASDWVTLSRVPDLFLSFINRRKRRRTHASIIRSIRHRTVTRQNFWILGVSCGRILWPRFRANDGTLYRMQAKPQRSGQ